ncbi:MAG: hypothetical protein HDT42_04635 [Ruminococcaceae bacterium]|nr:hypothetical protein [Oscillospiraceae bacterium]
MKLSYQRALWAAYSVLNELYKEKGDTIRLAEILSEMNPFLFIPRTCADPALWVEWKKCCSKIDDSGFLTSEQVMPALEDFLRVNEEEYSCFDDMDGDYSADEIIRELSSFMKNGTWNKILDWAATANEIEDDSAL